ncbi:hypothetical protein [Paraburkholderia aspalathi]|uniref:hypothetical protein n=1 Tax=Paraburkholderia aspalathi TaxID=1324617 RepID=UPI0038B943C9
MEATSLIDYTGKELGALVYGALPSPVTNPVPGRLTKLKGIIRISRRNFAMVSSPFRAIVYFVLREHMLFIVEGHCSSTQRTVMALSNFWHVSGDVPTIAGLKRATLQRIEPANDAISYSG